MKKSLPDNEQYRVACEECNRETNHQVIASVEESDNSPDYEYQSTHYWKIIQCKGCDTISFLKNYHDNEDWAYDEDGPCEPEDHIELYPPRRPGRKKIKHLFKLPTNVRKIYDETLLAICNNQNILAGIGIRALLEVICIENKTTGKDLFKKIQSLKNKGFISEEEEKLLHNSRILGNIVVHEVISLPEEILDTLLDISEHILKSIYILPDKNVKLEKEIKCRKKPKQKK